MNKPHYLLNETIINTISLYIILKKIMTPFEQWDAFKLGLIDKKGKKLKKAVSGKERNAWDLLTRFCWNFRMILSKFVGPSQMVSYLTIAYLLKEQVDYFYVCHNKDILNESFLEDMTYEKQNTLFTFLKEMDKVYTLEKITEDNIEVKFLQYEPHVKRIVEELGINFEELI